MLPFHGPRAPVANRPAFPAPDPRFTNEGFRQAVWDLTALLAWLRARGHGPIHLAGMSLGGYTAALLGTLVQDLASLLLVVPLASLALFARQHGRFGAGRNPPRPCRRPSRRCIDPRARSRARPGSPRAGCRWSRRGPTASPASGTRSCWQPTSAWNRGWCAGATFLQHHLPWTELLSDRP